MLRRTKLNPYIKTNGIYRIENTIFQSTNLSHNVAFALRSIWTDKWLLYETKRVINVRKHRRASIEIGIMSMTLVVCASNSLNEIIRAEINQKRCFTRCWRGLRWGQIKIVSNMNLPTAAGKNGSATLNFHRNDSHCKLQLTSMYSNNVVAKLNVNVVPRVITKRWLIKW